jgi:hypothetical protein
VKNPQPIKCFVCERMHQTVTDLIITSDSTYKSTTKRNNSRTISRHCSYNSYTRNPLSGKHNIKYKSRSISIQLGHAIDGRSFSRKFRNNQTTTTLGAEQRSWQYHRYSFGIVVSMSQMVQ